MITITVVRDDDGSIIGFEAEGHSLRAEAGEDIVCASITILFDYLTRLIEELPEDTVKFRQYPETPKWEIEVNQASLEDNQRYLLETSFEKAEASFRAISLEHSEACEITDRTLKG